MVDKKKFISELWIYRQLNFVNLNYIAITHFIVLEFFKMEIRKNLKKQITFQLKHILITPNQKVNPKIRKFNS